MRCPYCAIDLKREAETIALSREDYVRFVDDLCTHYRVDQVSTPGHEPLLPESWGTTRAVLETAKRHNVPRTLTTNGTYLEARTDEIVELDSDVFVSLDASTPEEHDRLRRTAGGFDAAIRGIRAFRRRSPHVVVNTVLFPTHPERLEGLPGLLAGLGVVDWVVSPLIRPGGPVETDLPRFTRQVEAARAAAAAHGVELILDISYADFGSLKGLYVHRFKQADLLVRLTPSGACLFNEGFLEEVTAETPVWSRDVPPSEFVRRHTSRHQ